MKNLSLFLLLITVLFALTTEKNLAKSKFSQALKNCETYSQKGSITHNNEVFNISITLNKTFLNKCVYKEKIYQDNNYQMLTCTFKQNQLDYISDSMSRFYETFRVQISKNPIFEAKLTTNGEIFQKYLIDQKYCKITHSKK